MPEPLDLDALENDLIVGYQTANRTLRIIAELRALRRENEELRWELQQFTRPWNSPADGWSEIL